MDNGKITFGKQSGGKLSLVFPDGVDNTEVIFPVSGELVTKEYVDAIIAAPTLTIPSMVVNERSFNLITIDAYDANVTYNVSAQRGSINSIVGNTITYQAPNVLEDTTDTITIYYKLGTLLSKSRSYTLNIINVPPEADDTIQVVDFINEASFNDGFDII